MSGKLDKSKSKKSCKPKSDRRSRTSDRDLKDFAVPQPESDDSECEEPVDREDLVSKRQIEMQERREKREHKKKLNIEKYESSKKIKNLEKDEKLKEMTSIIDVLKELSEPTTDAERSRMADKKFSYKVNEYHKGIINTYKQSSYNLETLKRELEKYKDTYNEIILINKRHRNSDILYSTEMNDDFKTTRDYYLDVFNNIERIIKEREYALPVVAPPVVAPPVVPKLKEPVLEPTDKIKPLKKQVKTKIIKFIQTRAQLISPEPDTSNVIKEITENKLYKNTIDSVILNKFTEVINTDLFKTKIMLIDSNLIDSIETTARNSPFSKIGDALTSHTCLIITSRAKIFEGKSVTQVMTFFSTLNIIMLQLSAEHYTFTSTYRISTDPSEEGRSLLINKKIIFDPVTNVEQQKIKTIKKNVVEKFYLHSYKNGKINIVKFLNLYKYGDAEPIIINESLDDASISSEYRSLKLRFEQLTTRPTGAARLSSTIYDTYAELQRTSKSRTTNNRFTQQYDTAKEILKDIASYKEHKQNLLLWRKNYIKYYENQKTKEEFPISEFSFKCIKREYGPEMFDRNSIELLERFSPYDTLIRTDHSKLLIENHLGTIEKDIICGYDIRLNRPYLVDDILRHKSLNARISSDKLLGINKHNITEFTKFIHDFKSLSFSLVSLFFNVEKILSNCKTSLAIPGGRSTHMINLIMSNFYPTDEFKDVPLEYEESKYKLNVTITCNPKSTPKCALNLQSNTSPEENIVEPTKESFRSNLSSSRMQINMYPLILDEPLYEGMYQFDKEYFNNCKIEEEYYDNFINLVDHVEYEQIPEKPFNIEEYIRRTSLCPERTVECSRDDDEPAAASLDEPAAASLDEPAAASLDEDTDEAPDETLYVPEDETVGGPVGGPGSDSSFNKYLKYKTKYLALKKKLNIH